MKKNLIALFFSAILLVFAVAAKAQMDLNTENAPGNWFMLDAKADNYKGVSVDKAYNQLLKDKQPSKVIVAIIDSGVDIEHEDLKDVIWINNDEIKGNNIDDDKNGYVDDIHGWNFIGGADGKNVEHDTYEITRLFSKYSDKFEGKNENEISNKKEYKKYLKYKKEFYEAKAEAEAEYEGFKTFLDVFDMADSTLTVHFGKGDYTIDDVKNLEPDNNELLKAKRSVLMMDSFGLTKAKVKEAREYFTRMLDYNYNLQFDPRHIVGDDYENSNEKIYGNNNVKGPSCEHGTHVSGIVAAKRNNNTGIDGIAGNVEIMVLRVVPEGDERDKDVANAVRYAADNGAKIINMSFGKLYSPYKKVVDQAFEYAQSKGVLMIHAAGNDAENNDKVAHYPTRDLIDSRGEIENWIEVGASSWGHNDKFVANFSNYGRKSVDIFAPGVDINSTYPGNNYVEQSGTSMAAPVVTGVAALLLSYYPELTAQQLKEAIIKSAVDYSKLKVNKPNTEGESKTVKFKKLSRSGKIINAYNAVKYIEDNF